MTSILEHVIRVGMNYVLEWKQDSLIHARSPEGNAKAARRVGPHDFRSIQITATDDAETQEVTGYDIKRNGNFGFVASVLEDMLNSFNNHMGQGVGVGLIMRNAHRTLQGSFVNWCLGCLIGIAQQEYTDARNEVAVRTAQRIEALMAGESRNLDETIELIEGMGRILEDMGDTKNFTLKERRIMREGLIDQARLAAAYARMARQESQINGQPLI